MRRDDLSQLKIMSKIHPEGSEEGQDIGRAMGIDDRLETRGYLDGINFSNFFSSLIQVYNILHSELVIFNNLP